MINLAELERREQKTEDECYNSGPESCSEDTKEGGGVSKSQNWACMLLVNIDIALT